MSEPWRITDVPTSKCWCGVPVKIVATPGRQPRPGDMSICQKCARLMKFDDDMRLREVTDQEMLDVVDKPEWVQALLEAKRQIASRR